MYHLFHDRVTPNSVERIEKFTILRNDYDYVIYSKMFSFGVFISCTSSVVIVICVIET
jgi:hypothetical protein